MVAQATQFCVALENRSGSFASLCSALGRGGVIVDAIFVSDDEDYCWVNFVAHPQEAAETVLSSGEYHFFRERVLAMQLDNRPGALERIAAQLAEAGVNIDYVYGGGLGGAPFTLVLNVSDLERALEVLNAEPSSVSIAI